MIASTPSPEDYQHIREKIIDYLSRQGFSERKLLKKITDLKRRYPRTRRYFFYTKAHVQKVINECKARGLIDDRKYAQDVLRQLVDRKDGVNRIRQKMQQRLIPTSIVEETLQAWQRRGGKQDYTAIIRETKRKRQRLCEKYSSKKDYYVIRTKLYAFLVQKGYQPDEIRKIILKAR